MKKMSFPFLGPVVLISTLLCGKGLPAYAQSDTLSQDLEMLSGFLDDQDKGCVLSNSFSGGSLIHDGKATVGGSVWALKKSCEKESRLPNGKPFKELKINVEVRRNGEAFGTVEADRNGYSFAFAGGKLDLFNGFKRGAMTLKTRAQTYVIAPDGTVTMSGGSPVDAKAVAILSRFRSEANAFCDKLFLLKTPKPETYRFLLTLPFK